jgi:hypothetical protein
MGREEGGPAPIDRKTHLTNRGWRTLRGVNPQVPAGIYATVKSLSFSAEFLFEVGDPLLQIGETVESGHHAEPLAVFDGRITGIKSALRDIVGDAALRGDDGAVADS